VYAGSQVVGDWLTWLGTNVPWVLTGLQIAGGLLPAIGIAMNMRFIFRGSVIPYFFVGYLLFVVGAGAGFNIVAIGIVGVAFGFLHVFFLGERAVQQRGA
jgi:D-glucosaminate PTS system EIIC component